MEEDRTDVGQFDEWLSEGSEIAAITMRQWLEPVEGRGTVIFPPTYPLDENKTGYNLDSLGEGRNLCQLDSVGSQANRMEPLFKLAKYRELVPQVVIKGAGREIHLLDAGHRAADAVVRFSTLGPAMHEAFRSFQRDGRAEKLARIAPTSIIFGSWDSRATQAKLPRIVRSVIRAFDVVEVHRSAQYTTIAGEIMEGPDAEVTTKGPKAELGLAHVPAVRSHGGVLVSDKSEIRRDAALNLVPLRALRSDSGSPQDDLKLRRYLLGLSLVAFTAFQDSSLREGCQLVLDGKKKPVWRIVKHDGSSLGFDVTHQNSLDYASASAKAFGVEQGVPPGEFDTEVARQVMDLSEEDRKALLRQGPVTREALQKLRAKRRGKSGAEKPTAEKSVG